MMVPKSAKQYNSIKQMYKDTKVQRHKDTTQKGSKMMVPNSLKRFRNDGTKRFGKISQS